MKKRDHLLYIFIFYILKSKNNNIEKVMDIIHEELYIIKTSI